MPYPVNKAAKKSSALEPFSVRSFRFQWPADLAASWGFEMEALIMGWYILAQTNSVVMLTLVGAFRFLGTLLSPWFGVAGDRFGRRGMMLYMRGALMALAAIIMVLALLDILLPIHVLTVAFLAGLIQPSDILMRNALVGDTIPQPMILGAISISRTAHDSARIFGALTGAGVFAFLGMGYAYVFVVVVYGIGLYFTANVSRAHPLKDGSTKQDAGKTSQLQELKVGLLYIWNTPAVLAIMWLAFLANLTAFPLTHGLMPFVARDVLQVDENGLGQLLAAFSAGAVLGALLLAWFRAQKYSSRMMLINLVMWYAMLVIFTVAGTKISGIVILVFVGIAHSFSMVSMAAALLEKTDQMVRGRIMGVRVLAVYGVPLGLLGAGFLIESVGFVSFIWIYASIGTVFTLLIGIKWRKALWPL